MEASFELFMRLWNLMAEDGKFVQVMLVGGTMLILTAIYVKIQLMF